MRVGLLSRNGLTGDERKMRILHGELMKKGEVVGEQILPCSGMGECTVTGTPVQEYSRKLLETLIEISPLRHA